MAIDAAQYIGNLNELLPAAGEQAYDGDDQIRAAKKATRQTFPNCTGPVTASHTELSHVAGVTASIQPQINSKAPIASPSFTGTPTAPTATLGTDTTQLATTAFVKAATDVIAGFNGAALAAAVAAAEASAEAAAAYAGAAPWVSGTTYAIGVPVWSPANRLLYRRRVAGAGTTDPSADATNWGALVDTSLSAAEFFFHTF